MAAAYEAIEERLARDEVVLLDGATGTELERRGVPMVEGAWCGLANFTHPDTVRQVHEDYVRVGCDVIIANTFASSRHMLEAAGHGDRAPDGYRIAVRLAREAVARASGGRTVAVAGSLSTARPVARGRDRQAPLPGLTSEQEAANYREAAEALAAAGADLIVLEMISDFERGAAALEAALATGLPVLRRHWSGPVLVYPEQGWFEAPHWHFVELDPEAFADAALRWVAQGARIVGGCCGIGPEHIAALARRLGRLTPA